MDLKKLKKHWTEEEHFAFKGWDFSHLQGRWVECDLPWDYRDIVKKYLKSTDKLLDMGTGGGEFLLSLKHPYSLTSVTEAYEPNVMLCKEKLGSLGITVKQVYKDAELPFEDNSFDIILNRHESFDAKEVQRILKSDKLFITQQVGGQNNADISKKVLGSANTEYGNHTLRSNIELLENAGFDIIFSDEVFVPLKFFDVGAFVYFAKIIEWEFPGFSVEKHFDKLCKLQKEIEQKAYFESTEHRFIIAAKKCR